MRKLTMAALLLVGFAGTAGAADEKVSLTKDSWKAYQDYSDWLTPMGRGIFAVSLDGLSWGAWGCPSGSCSANSASASKALKDCEAHTGSVHCVVFARNHEIVVPYSVRQ